MPDSSILDLDPILRPLARQFLDACNAMFKTRIIVTWRSAEDQDKAHSQGLSDAMAGHSPHNCVDAQGNPASRGFDFAIYEKDGTYIKDGTHPNYAKAGEIAEGLGLVWGKHFPKPDYDHCQLKDWKNI